MSDLHQISASFIEMAHRIVWCTAATVDTSGQPSTRVLHPIWEFADDRLTGWVLTMPNSPKAAHLLLRPAMSLTYWAPNHDTCTAECATVWEDSPEQRRAGWDRFLHGPAPVGYDPSVIPGWSGPDVPSFGVLRLEPRRLRVMAGTVMLQGQGEVLTWRAGPS